MKERERVGWLSIGGNLLGVELCINVYVTCSCTAQQHIV